MKVLLVSVVAAVAAFRLIAQPTEVDPALKTYQTVKVAEGIYAFISPESKAPLVSGNCTAVIGEDGVLVVDSGHFPSLTRRMIGEIRQMTDKPVRYLVNTHWHADHVTGNNVYREVFPNVIIMSTPDTQERLAKPLPQYDDRTQITQAVPVIEEILRSGKSRNGAPLSDDARRYYEIMLNDGKYALAEFQQPKPAPPTLTFERAIKVNLGNREVEIRFLGRGHSAGDAVVYVPDSRVLITGDLLVNPIPYAYGSFIEEWIATLKELSNYDATAIIPGHGPVERDKLYLQQVVALLETLTNQVHAGVKEGLDLEQVRSKVDFADFKEKMAGNDYFRGRAFDDRFVRPGVERAYREAKEGKLKDEN